MPPPCHGYVSVCVCVSILLFGMLRLCLCVCVWCDMLILTSNRMLADLSILSALFCAWQWIVLLWSALFAFSFKMDFAVDKRLSGDGSFIYWTPAVKTFPKPSIHVIYTVLCITRFWSNVQKHFTKQQIETNVNEENDNQRRRKNPKDEKRKIQMWSRVNKKDSEFYTYTHTHTHKKCTQTYIW